MNRDTTHDAGAFPVNSSQHRKELSMDQTTTPSRDELRQHYFAVCRTAIEQGRFEPDEGTDALFARLGVSRGECAAHLAILMRVKRLRQELNELTSSYPDLVGRDQ